MVQTSQKATVKTSSGKVQQKVKQQAKQNFVFIQKKQQFMADQPLVMRPKVLQEETMVEMEVDEETVESERRRTAVAGGFDASIGGAGNSLVVTPLGQNYLKYC